MSKEPPHLRRPGALWRDKDGWDVGTIKVGTTAVRALLVHRENGDVLWGHIYPDPADPAELIFASAHAETKPFDNEKGDEHSLLVKVVLGLGGTAPKQT